LGVGSSEKLTLLYADGMNVAWRSSNVKIASVEEGVVTAKARGNARITAYVNGKGYNCTVKVTDKYTAPTTFDDVNSFTIRPTQTLNLKNVAVGGVKPNKLDWRLSDESGSRDVDKSGWRAWDDGVVRVNVNGKLTAKACGSSTVIGKTGDYRIKTVRVNVSTIPSKTETYINVGRNERLSYYKVNNSKASWSATGVGEIVQLGSTGGSKGRVYGLKPGTSVVTCSYNGMVYSTTVHVERPELASGNGLFKVKANEYMLTLKSGTRFVLDMPEVVQTITWKSADKRKAFVDERGIVEGRNTGTTVVSTKINGTLVKVKVYVLQ
ncbi:MAG: hypothetical protein IJ805_05430, partial [Lachnospiraceae bacterium]|nr:hypothetical protein [Lachnospiraceae bacterium]